MLTKKQKNLLIFINKKIRSTGISPSYEEMKNSLNLKSKSGIHRLISALEERGFVKRLAHKARALEVLKLPENYSVEKNTFIDNDSSLGSRPTAKSNSNVIAGNFSSADTDYLPESEVIELPVYGKIAAGTPIEALRDNANKVNVPSYLLGKGEHYALEVEGDSMSDAGIIDGDVALILRADTADNGTIVVALVDNSEVTLKRIRRKGQSIALEPANSNYKTRICGPDQVKVQGKLVGLLRKY